MCDKTQTGDGKKVRQKAQLEGYSGVWSAAIEKKNILNKKWKNIRQMSIADDVTKALSRDTMRDHGNLPQGGSPPSTCPTGMPPKSV